MKKLIALVALATAFGVRADSYLYWMVGDSVSMKSGATETTTDFSGYKYAAVGVWNATTGESAGYLNLFGSNGADLGTTVGMKGSSFYADLASYTDGYSFYIELFNDQGSVGRSEDLLSYNAAMEYITSFGTATPPTSKWAPSSFTTAAIPEPSSALLMLLGCAGLALKRKKQAKA